MDDPSAYTLLLNNIQFGNHFAVIVWGEEGGGIFMYSMVQ